MFDRSQRRADVILKLKSHRLSQRPQNGHRHLRPTRALTFVRNQSSLPTYLMKFPPDEHGQCEVQNALFAMHSLHRRWSARIGGVPCLGHDMHQLVHPFPVCCSQIDTVLKLLIEELDSRVLKLRMQGASTLAGRCGNTTDHFLLTSTMTSIAQSFCCLKMLLLVPTSQLDALSIRICCSGRYGWKNASCDTKLHDL